MWLVNLIICFDVYHNTALQILSGDISEYVNSTMMCIHVCMPQWLTVNVHERCAALVLFGCYHTVFIVSGEQNGWMVYLQAFSIVF